MPFNLIRDPWIPVRRTGGAREMITPDGVTSNYDDDPVIALDAPRPDFNGALIQFLIGLVQTTAAPEHEKAWRAWLKKPPDPAELRERFETVGPYFNLDGPKPRFMQDLELDKAVSKPIAELLIDSPGGKTLDDNTDHFVKRNGVIGLCSSCAAAALFALQTNAPSGGVGHRTSLRGGGPLTTLILGRMLWHTIWFNILTEADFSATSGNSQKKQPSDSFPWNGPTRTSQKKGGRTTTPLDAHPIQMFWGMPRRIVLNSEDTATGGCSICVAASDSLIEQYVTQNYGVNYEGAWWHPLSPYGQGDDGFPAPRHAQPGGVSYRHWLGLVIEDLERTIKPARVVQQFYEDREKTSVVRELIDGAALLWAFGYDMDNMKARCWYESLMPVVTVSDEVRDDFEHLVRQLVSTAVQVSKELRKNLRKAGYHPGAKAKRDLSVIDSRFWQATESGFYETLERIRQHLTGGEDTLDDKKQWLSLLRRWALAIFDELSQTGRFEAADPKRIALARRDLTRFTGERNKRIQDLLGLPQE